MAATDAQIRTALAAALTGITTTQAGGVQVSGYLLSQPTAPAFEIEPDPEGIEYDLAFNRGLDRSAWVVRGIAGTVSDLGAQKLLDTWRSPSGASSVKAAIETDVTLGGVVKTLQVTRVSGYRQINSATANTVYLAAEWSVTVYP